MDNVKRLNKFYKFRVFLNKLPSERKDWGSTSRHGSGLRLHSCNTSGCIGGWASVYFEPRDCMLTSMFKEIFDVTHEEAEFVCYGHGWSEYNEPVAECLEDWNEAMRRFNKLIDHYEFLEGKAPEPGSLYEPLLCSCGNHDCESGCLLCAACAARD